MPRIPNTLRAGWRPCRVPNDVRLDRAGAGHPERRSANWWSNMWKEGQTTPWEMKTMSPEQRQRLARHSAFMNKDVPQVYLDAENEVGYTTRAILEGGDLYAANCAKCHGDTGLGNGEAAGDMAPSPALLRLSHGPADRHRSLSPMDHLRRRRCLRHQDARLQGCPEQTADLADRRLSPRGLSGGRARAGRTLDTWNRASDLATKCAGRELENSRGFLR